MSDNTEFLKTEMLVHNLLEELNKLKSAVDQIEDTKNSAKSIRESAENIVRATTELLTTGKTILNRVDEVRFKERFDEVEKLGKDSVENDKMIINRMNKLDKYNIYLSIGTIGILVFQAATLVFLYLR